MTTLTLTEIAALLNCPRPSGADRAITGMATLAEATESDLSFIGSETYLSDFEKTRAAAVIVQKRVKLPAGNTRAVFVVDNADLAVATILEKFAPPVPRPAAGVDSSAHIASSARLGDGVAIGINVVIGERCVIGRGTVIHPGVVIGDDVTIGEDCELFPNVVVRERITIGNRVIIHASSVLGTDGFGYRWDGQRHVKVPQIGTVIIEDDVEIGSGVCIDRAKFSSTRIGRGSKIDNLVQIGHNVQVGAHCIIVGQAGLAGSVRLGQGVVLGGQAAIRDHITIGDGAIVAACAAIMENIEPKAIVSGMPALPHRQSLREQAALRRLPDLVVQVRKLTEELASLKQAQGK
ncbi:MAG TPA: UDP-3-O-(3-hydroxymyristoyl)glucosamine N-acyltransferase [Tepidisphaeraceae bacterium]|nr:UDP-3-O-(3-hydroxymyristoyl)glucosamine N-acyltransferase [Tepidisphaeraceae bacterium]